MALEPGTRFGSYEIAESIGAGGMGEVYRAKDTKLDREVAVKTLSSTVADDHERLQRFDREAKLLAALNHPNIAAVHSLDEQDGTVYLVMELVEGDTLEERLKAGALTVDDSLRIALQIAEALDAAHSKGVVHRDLKPANVMLTAEGQVKVLDFGLAKAFSGPALEASPLHSPALSVAMTQAGLVLGTAGYMAPEQASGQGADQRADIWAFGVVVYEMLTGLPLFSGESVPHILADVLKTEPDWDRLPTGLHPRIRLMLERCLAKKPRNRYHAIADARSDIEAALSDPEGITMPVAAKPAAQATGARLINGAGFAAAGAALAALGAWALWPTVPVAEPGSVVRFSSQMSADSQPTTGGMDMLALSPDGKRIAYAMDRQLYLRELSEPEARPVPGTLESGPGAGSPVFSPDGQWLAYIAAATNTGPYIIKRVPISGGAPVPVHETTGGPNLQQGLSWPTPDQMMFANAEGIVRIPANGGATEVLVPRGDGERFHSPQLLPGGNSVLFTRLPLEPGQPSDLSGGQVAVQSIGSDDRTIVWEGGTAARYVSSGHLVYGQGTALYGVAFDLAERTVSGGAVQMAGELRRGAGGFTDAANFEISDTGTLVSLRGGPGIASVIAGGNLPATTLTWVDRSGAEEPLAARPDGYTAARVSPDGRRIALVVGMINVGGAQVELPTIWLYDLRTENLRLLTTTPANGDGPVWSPDGNRIYFRGFDGPDAEESFGIYAVEVSTGAVELVAPQRNVAPEMPWSIDPDEQTLTLISARDLTDVNLATLALEEGTFELLLDPDGPGLTEPSLAPNGQWIAYQTNVGGETEVNIRPFPNVGRTRIPVGSGTLPVFSRDGSALYFYDGQSIVAASIEYEPDIDVGPPVRLFDMRAYRAAGLGRAWDVDPSSERFLMIRQPSASAETGGMDAEPLRIDIVLNWVEELTTRVPTN
jgi:serine/threonine-protein kinase